MWNLAEYDPDDTWGNAVAELMRAEPFILHRFTLDEPGVYALFYTGPFPDYDDILSPDASLPIYVGQTKRLGLRLRAHATCLDETFNLERKDFLCRILRLPYKWPIPVEAALIERFQPRWNQPEYAGFGNDGSPRVSGKAAPWDIFHEGRRRALEKERPSAEEILRLRQEARRAVTERERERRCFAELFGGKNGDGRPAERPAENRPEERPFGLVQLFGLDRD